MTIEALLTEQNELLRELLARLPANVTKAETAAEVAVAKAKTAEPDVPAGESVKKVTYDEAKAAVTSVVKAKGRDGGLKVLAKFDTQSLLEVPEDQWAAVIAACEEALTK